MPQERQEKTDRTSQKNIDLINSLKIKTERLSIEKFCDLDIEQNIAQENDPNIMKYIRDPLPLEQVRNKSVQMAKAWSGNEGDWCLFSIRQTKNKEYLGLLSMRYESIVNDTVELGWRLHTNYHGNGYATEAASAFLQWLKEQINPHKFVAYCVTENKASSNVMKKIGMQQEGCLREFSKLNGKWCDEDIFGLLN